MVEFGKTFKAWLMIRGHRHSHKWCVTCVNCGCIERGVPLSTRASFRAYIKRKGWFQNKKGKWSCGSHGERGDDRVEHWVLEMDVPKSKGKAR